MRLPVPPEKPSAKRAAKTVVERDLSGWRHLERFVELLERHKEQSPANARETHGLRDLDRRSYLSLFLLGLFNPVVESMRGVCRASALPKVRELAGVAGQVGISSFSDAQKVYDPQLLQPVIGTLLAESFQAAGAGVGLLNIPGGGRLSAAALRVVDSTVWKVLPRMQWAHWRHQNKAQNAVRLHVKLRLADLQPDAGTILEPAKGCERAALRRRLNPGEFYLGDRYYGEDYQLFEQMRQKGCGFVIRLLNTSRYTIEGEAAKLDEAARAQGVKLDAKVRLGHRGKGGTWRIIEFQKPGMAEMVRLVCSEECCDLSAVEVMELYRLRWQVEMFFRWLKCLVPCRHWFAESPRGVAMQVYLALILALLLAQHNGRLPNKAMMEMLRWHQLGMMSDEELAAQLARYEAQRAKRQAAAKQKSAKA